MKLWKRWKEIRRGELVTVCWVDEGISMALWRRGADGEWARVGSSWREADRTDERGYRESLSEVLSGRTVGGLRIRWILLQEAYPVIPEAGKERSHADLAVPGWMRSCWEALVPRELPECLISGTEALSGLLCERPGLMDPGSACLQLVGSRLVLMAYGNERLFRRVSRKDLYSGPAKASVAGEWLLQSRILFRNRTGMDLNRITASGDFVSSLAESGVTLPIDLVVDADFDGESSVESAGLPGGTGLLHSSAARNRVPTLAQIDLPALNQRKCWARWETRLRFGSCLLLGCWGFMLLGACRHEALVPDMRLEQASQMAQYRHQLVARQEEWQRSWVEKRSRSRPFQLVSGIVGSLPEGIEVNRFRMAQASEPGLDGIYLTLEGKFSGEQNTRTFRNWIKALQASPHIQRIENLRLARNAEEITFSMEGHSGSGGNSR